VIVDEDANLPSYRRLIVSRGVVVGAIVLGHHPDVLAAVTSAVKKRLLLDMWTVDQLRAGNWLVLKDAGRRPAAVS
jgi:nitrite reductase (NADH) large subunit